MSVKYEVDVEKLRDITGENKNYQCPDELKKKRDRINGMIENNVMFCTLITGYRGTGKTTFVNSIVNNLPQNVVTVVINVAKYKDYEVFIKRFIRELFLQYRVDEENGQEKPESIKQLYLHTFYDLKNINSLEIKKDEEKGLKQCKKKIVTGKVNINLQKILTFLICMVFDFFALWITDKTGQQILGWIAVFITTVLYIFNNIKISTEYQFDNEKIFDQSRKENRIEEKKIYIENLYDDEIAEYHLFNIIRETSIKHKRQLLLVLDEMDKIVEDEKLQRIFSELKPLFLSNYCNVIVVAGKNVDSLLFYEEGKEDSVIDSLFTHQIYVPLCTLDENKLFVERLFTKESHSHIIKSREAQSYLKKIVIRANGNRRKAINLFLGDLVWENEKAYIYLDDDNSNKGFDKLYDVIVKMEEFILSLYEDEKSDEAIYYTYQLLNYIRKQKSSEFNKEQIVELCGVKEEKRTLYIELCSELLKTMEAEKLLYCTNEKYVWIHENNEEKGMRVNYSEISENMALLKELERLFVRFGQVFNVTPRAIKCIRFFFGRKVIQRDEFVKLKECVWISNKIENKNIDDNRLQTLYDNLGELKRKKALWAQELLCLTIKEYSSYDAILLKDIIQKTGMDSWKYHYKRYDAILYDSKKNKILVTEFKFYRNYISGINSRILELLNEMQVVNNQCKRKAIKIEFLLVFLVDGIVPTVRKLLKESIEVVMKEVDQNKEIDVEFLNNMHIEVIALDDTFNNDMSHMLEHLKNTNM